GHALAEQRQCRLCRRRRLGPRQGFSKGAQLAFEVHACTYGGVSSRVRVPPHTLPSPPAATIRSSPSATTVDTGPKPIRATGRAASAWGATPSSVPSMVGTQTSPFGSNNAAALGSIGSCTVRSGLPVGLIQRSSERVPTSLPPS